MNGRQVVFAADADYQRYLTDIRELKDAFGVKVYAYCQMTNHVHLLLAPGESTTGLSQLMKTLAAGRALRYALQNKAKQRTKGTDLNGTYLAEKRGQIYFFA